MLKSGAGGSGVCGEVNASIAVTDENPLRYSERWRWAVAERISIPLLSVDADVIVPTALVQKEQYGARTIPPRIYKLLPEFLKPVGNLRSRYAGSQNHFPLHCDHREVCCR